MSPWTMASCICTKWFAMPGNLVASWSRFLGSRIEFWMSLRTSTSPPISWNAAATLVVAPMFACIDLPNSRPPPPMLRSCLATPVRWSNISSMRWPTSPLVLSNPFIKTFAPAVPFENWMMLAVSLPAVSADEPNTLAMRSEFTTAPARSSRRPVMA